MRVAVTGGSGVVGSALVRHLLAEGHRVRALSRSEHARQILTTLGAEAVSGDVLMPSSLDLLVEGADRVFHVAGVNETCVRDPGTMWAVNVDGTRNVIDACRRAGVARLVHTSSAVTMGQRKAEVGTETTKHRGWYLSEYERSKTAAERLALSTGDVDLVVVNPSSVQGPGRATGTGRIFLAAARGRLPLAVDSTISIVDIDDCARGHLLAADKGSGGERYLLSGTSLSVSGALRMLAAVTGRRVRTVFLPARSLAPVAAAVEIGSRLFGLTAPLCRETARLLTHGHAYDGSKATHELGLEYTPVSSTIERTVGWFRSEGLLAPHS